MMRATVMEGSLAEFDLPSVMQVVSIGRQYTGVELFDASGSVVGTLLLKSGKILAANSGALSGLEAVTRLLRVSPENRFAVYRTEAAQNVAAPVGAVGEILLKMIMSPPAAPAPRVPVMEGSLAEFDLLSVLQVVSIGRQFVAVEVTDPAKTLIGKIDVKAGKVIAATSGHLQGIDSIRKLLRSPPESRFGVYRINLPLGETALGSLASIALQLSDPDDEWEGLDSATRSRGLPVVAPHPADSQANADAKQAAARARAPEAAPPPPPTAPALPREEPVARPVSKAPAQSPPAPKAESSPFVADAYTSPRGMAVVPGTDVPIICVTSPKGGAGKTTVTLNLSVALARRGKRVIVVDADHNGILLALNAEDKTQIGAADVVAGRARLEEALVQTRLGELRILPSGNWANPFGASREDWRKLLTQVAGSADLVLVDVAAGMHGPTAEICAGCTHSLVVVPAEPLALRGLSGHVERIARLSAAPPKTVGIVINMLDYRARASLDVLKDLCTGPTGQWVFDVPIARSPAFMEAVARGIPISRGDRTDTPTVGWVFEMLASGILERLGVGAMALEDSPLL